MGIDPLLMKKGNLDEINRHLSNFHSYRPPSYTEEVWDQVSGDNLYVTSPKLLSVPAGPMGDDKEALVVPVAARLQFTAQNRTSYMQSLSPYCSSPPEAFAPSLPSSWPRPEIMSLPGTDYSVMGQGNSFPVPDATAVNANASPQDFYTCVQLMNESGDVHLVPCLPPPYCREFPPLQSGGDEKEEKKRKLAAYQARKNLTSEPKDGGKAERSEASVPLLPVAVDNRG
nr:PREDICTED: uncharacterized protein LOC109646624 [Paralichthys olivaceus]